MIYVMSDIHGCYDKYIKMLEKINLKKEDTLYILGDVVDRGSNILKIIDHIRANDNIIYLKGNHEEMMQGYLQDKIEPLNNEDVEEDIDFSHSWFDNLWFGSGGLKTYNELKEMPNDYVIDLYKYICELPMYATLTMKDGRNFLLVHAGLFVPDNQDKLSFYDILEMQDEETLLWDRSFAESNAELEGFTVVCGHTPVQTVINEDFYIDKDNISILHTQGKILIDCGAILGNKGKLACLRLSDMKEYYI